MPLIAERPQSWNQVIGQDRVVTMLHALLRSPKHMTRGFIFEGTQGVGKTSSAYLFARALMCQGKDPLGCGECDSCRTAIDSLDNHPDFTDIDAAALEDKADDARELVNRLNGPPILGRRKVVVLDEAHRLSPQAWDVFLKPLELRDIDVVLVFATSDSSKIPGTIHSRCAKLTFGLVDQETLIGMLMGEADRAGIRYQMGGLRALARYAAGRPRDAKKALSLVAALGEITAQSVETAVNFDAETVTQEVFQAIVARDLQKAIEESDKLAQRIGPVKVIEAFFSWFARDVFTASSVAPSFAPIKEMSAFFVKWSTNHHLPADIIPLFVVELNEMRSDLYRKSEREQVRPTSAHRTEAPRQVVKVAPADRAVSLNEFLAIMEE